MIGKAKFQPVGPRALFDPYFVPPILLHRTKEQRSLTSILNDSIQDEFSLNILYHGIQGIGKKVIVNKVIEDLPTSDEIHLLRIDCKEKYPEELIGSLIIEMSKINNINLNINPILNKSESLPHLWNIFKLSCKKLDNYLLLIFNNAEYLNSDLFKKFLHLKETNTTLISTVNKILRPSTLDITQLFDQKKKLNYFTYNELFSILKQRTTLTFSHEIDKELIEYITDIIFENYAPVPGKGIEIMRELYPALKDKKDIKYKDMTEVCRNHFESESIDEFSLLTYISEEDLLTVIFLDNLSNHFIDKSNYYITSNKLKELYDLSCEYLEYRKDLQEFKILIESLQKLGIVCPSKKSLIENRFNTMDPFNCVYFFMVVDPILLKAMIDTVFGQF